MVDAGRALDLNEFHLILARDATRDLAPATAARARRLFADSLCRFGILAIGDDERFHPNQREWSYECFQTQRQLLRKGRT